MHRYVKVLTGNLPYQLVKKKNIFSHTHTRIPCMSDLTGLIDLVCLYDAIWIPSSFLTRNFKQGSQLQNNSCQSLRAQGRRSRYWDSDSMDLLFFCLFCFCFYFYFCIFLCLLSAWVSNTCKCSDVLTRVWVWVTLLPLSLRPAPLVSFLWGLSRAPLADSWWGSSPQSVSNPENWSLQSAAAHLRPASLSARQCHL